MDLSRPQQMSQYVSCRHHPCSIPHLASMVGSKSCLREGSTSLHGHVCVTEYPVGQTTPFSLPPASLQCMWCPGLVWVPEHPRKTFHCSCPWGWLPAYKWSLMKCIRNMWVNLPCSFPTSIPFHIQAATVGFSFYIPAGQVFVRCCY